MKSYSISENKIKMSRFPLYDSLKQGNLSKELTPVQKTELISAIASYDSEIHELFYMLILCYFNENNQNSVKIPYDGVVENDGNISNIDDVVDIRFDLHNFPTPLRNILYKFYVMHNKKLVDDKK